MIDALRSDITRRLGKAPSDLEAVLPYFQEVKTKRSEHLLREGQTCHYVYFIVKGCLQVYVIDPNGNESTREFYFENQWTTDIFGFQNQLPSKENIKCVEPCRLLRIHYDGFQQLAASIPQFLQVYRQILEVSYNNTVYRVNTLTSLNALDRIKWLMEHQPRILTRLSSKLVASYLGITPETMTRLKAKL